MFASNFISKSRCFWASVFNFKTDNFVRFYAKSKDEKECQRAIVDIPPAKDEVCPEPCERRKTKKGILHRIKLKILEGGSNFGTPFHLLRCEEPETTKKSVVQAEEKKEIVLQKALPPPKRKALPPPPPRAGLQVSVLGAETSVGQYIALLLKQCPTVKKLRLYEAKCPDPYCQRNLCSVVQDLQHINTNCHIQAFSCACCDLERCLQNTDVVLMMDDACAADHFEKRFNDQAPMVKRYADVIASECPKAFIVVCTTPVDCMVPLVAQTLKDLGWYNPRRLLGSLAVPEMRASSLAARALGLDPSYTKIPCVGGTEGESLVPLFSKAVDYYEFSRQNAEMLTETVRNTPVSIIRCHDSCVKAAELSEAHAIAGLVAKIANALLCKDIPHVTGFCQMNPGQVLFPSSFLANAVEISGSGISKNLGLPKLSDTETTLMNIALTELNYKQNLVSSWYSRYCSSSCRLDACQIQFFTPKHYERFDDCAYANM
ncbi:malate dehydrogenase-like [Battus philenor]|uniref:malate dehydrogenase-like n=1 Tax=Battus philenor TaxID=42288 RepID=UPI0035CFD641